MKPIYFFCSCGESYSRLGLAIDCRKCVRYLVDYDQRSVIAEVEGLKPRTVWDARDSDALNRRRYQAAMQHYRG